jgi:hypothetical protein
MTEELEIKLRIAGCGICCAIVGFLLGYFMGK